MNVGELLIRIGADTRGVRQGVNEAERELDRLPEERRVRIVIDTDERGGRGGGGGLQRNRNMLTAIVSLLPIAAAGIQASVGAMGGLVSMLGAATAGTAGFAAVAVSTLNDVFEAQKNITKANEDLAKASTEAERATAVNNLAQAYKGLNGYQLAALSSLQKFKSFWDDFAGSFQKPVVVGFSQALDGLQRVLQEMKPAIMGAANATLTMFQRFREFSNTTEFREFFGWLGGSAGTAINTFGIMAMNILRGVMNLMVAFQPVSMAMQGGLRGLSESFVKWTQSLRDSDKFQQFVNFTISFGPTFLNFIKQLGVLLGDLIHALAPLGSFMLKLINVVLALFNAFTAFVLSLSSTKRRVDDLANSIRALFGFQKKTASSMTDALVDVDKVYKDIFGSVGDFTGGINDSKKAMDGFLASFDEVHQVPDFSEAGGGFTPPTAPSGGSGVSGGGGNQPVMDDAETQESTGWLQKLIDKLKELALFFPFKMNFEFNPFDGGASALSAAWGLMAASFNATSIAIQGYWHNTLDYIQGQWNAYEPYLTFGWNMFMYTLMKFVPTAETVKLAWHTMLDYLQSQLNAYRPYIEYGISLIGVSLDELQSEALTLADGWGKAWQNMYANLHVQANKIISDINSVIAAYAAMKAATGQGAGSGSGANIQTHMSGGNQPVMDDLMGVAAPQKQSLGDVLKNFDYGSWFKDAAKDLGSAGIDMALSLLGAKGVQITGAIVKEVAEGAVKGRLQSVIEAILSRRQITDTAARTRGELGNVSGFANGGIIGTDSIVRVGEQGRQEAIIPLSGGAMQPFASAIASNMGGGGSGGGKQPDIVLNIDGVEFARVTAPYNIQESQRIGGNMITIK